MRWGRQIIFVEGVTLFTVIMCREVIEFLSVRLYHKVN